MQSSDPPVFRKLISCTFFTFQFLLFYNIAVKLKYDTNTTTTAKYLPVYVTVRRPFVCLFVRPSVPDNNYQGMKNSRLILHGVTA